MGRGASRGRTPGPVRTRRQGEEAGVPAPTSQLAAACPVLPSSLPRGRVPPEAGLRCGNSDPSPEAGKRSPRESPGPRRVSLLSPGRREGWEPPGSQGPAPTALKQTDPKG